MADPRFFSRAGPFTLGALAELSGARLLRPDEGGRLFYDVSPLETAGPEEVSFLENRKYVEAFVQSAAGAVIADQWAAERAPPAMALILSNAPYKAYALIARAFYPEQAAIPSRASSALTDRIARGAAPRGTDRPGRVRFRARSGRPDQGSTARAGCDRRRCGHRREHHDRPRIRSRYRDRLGFND